MRILVSNDDGYRAPGVKVLADALRPLGSVCVVAPESNRSGASNSLTLDRPLRLGEASTDFYWVDAQGFSLILDKRPSPSPNNVNFQLKKHIQGIYSRNK